MCENTHKNSNLKLVSERVTVLIVVRSRPPPSPATLSSDEPKVGCALRSTTHPKKSRGQNISHTPPRAATNPRQIRRVKSTCRPPATRSSTRCHQNQIPHSIIFPHDPLFHVSPRVFGCTCFVHDLSPGLDKLSAKAIKCVFLGYSRLKKDYKCYSPTTRRYYISADVTFF